MPRNPRTSLNWEKAIQRGENPKGFTSQTANGTGHWKGTGWNKQYDYEMPQVKESAVWPDGRSNRTAE